MDTFRQNIGVDVSKDTFVAAFTVLLTGQTIRIKGTKAFANNHKGFQELIVWGDKFRDKNLPISYTMEATGVYYESLAFYLWEKKVDIHVLLPNKAKRFAQSLDVKSKTDNLDAKALGQMGAERRLRPWVLTSAIYRRLRTLTREREELVKERTRMKNQLHAQNHSGEPVRTYITRHKNHIKYIDKQIVAVEKEIKALAKKDAVLSGKVKKITTTPGLGFITVVTVAAETNGFASINNVKQLTSYAGYDIKLRESGKWKGKTTISKQGNSHIRHAMYMPSISSISHAETYKRTYERINSKKQNGLISGTAIQRKLLGLIFTLWSKDTEYIDNYEAVMAN